MCIDRWCERFPFCFCRTHKLGPRRVVRNTPLKPPYLKPQQAQVRQQEKEKRAVSATYPEEPFSPFCLPYQLQTAASPAFWQKVQFNRRGWQLDTDYLGRAGENSLHRIDRKSTRLNSSHDQISYAVFCLKKK